MFMASLSSMIRCSFAWRSFPRPNTKRHTRRTWRSCEQLETRLLLSAAATSTSVGVSASTIAFGTSVTLTATVAAQNSSDGTPTGGQVTFFDGATQLGQTALTAGTAVFQANGLAVGLHAIHADYGGNGSTFAASSSLVGSTDIVNIFAGNGNVGDGGPATGATVVFSAGVAIDAAGDLFFADAFHARIREVNHTTGIITTVAGNGTGTFSGDGGQATAASLNLPAAVALDNSGHLFIADLANSRIREVNLSTGIITTVAGNGTAGFSGDGGQATAAELKGAQRVAVDSSGHLFIADSTNNVIREVNLATGIISTVAGNGTPGFSGDGGQATSAQLSDPNDVGLDGTGDLFIADTNNNAIREVNLATGIISTVAGTESGLPGFAGDGGQATNAKLNSPNSVAVDSSGNLFISDTDNNVVREVNHASGVISTVAGNGTSGLSGIGGPATAAEISPAFGVAVDSSGNLFISMESDFTATKLSANGTLAFGGVAEVNHSTGIITMVAGSSSTSGTGDGGPATAASFGFPFALATDSTGNLFIGDGSRVREVNHATGIITTIAGTATSGFSGDGGQATAAQLSLVSALALDASGDLFISDAPNNRIRKVNLTTGIISTVAGNGTSGDTGDGGQATAAEIDTSIALAADASGHLFISETDNNVVREVNLSTGVITTIAGNTTAGSGFSGDGGQATAAQLDSPFGLAVDSSGHLFISDSGNNRIREVNLATGVISTYAGNGTAGFAGDGGQATAAEFSDPTFIALDATTGDLYISDVGNFRIREISAATQVVTTIAGTGSLGSSGNGGPATAAEVTAFGLAVDPGGTVYFVDLTDPGFIREIAATTSSTTVQVEPIERVYRVYLDPNHPNGDKHYFTTSLGEFNVLVNEGWHDETTGQGGFAILTQQLPGSLPLHMLYNPNDGEHYYTLSDGERNALVAQGWQFQVDEGFMFPIVQGSAAPAGTTEILRMYNQGFGGDHLFTENPQYEQEVLAEFPNVWVAQASLGYAYAVDGNGNVKSSEIQAGQNAAETAAPPAIATTTSQSATVNGDSASAKSPLDNFWSTASRQLALGAAISSG